MCEKSDGIRYLLYSTSDDKNEEAHYLIDRKNDYWYIPANQLHIPTATDEQGFHTRTITDGELVWDTLESGEREPRFLIFDCLVNDGLNLIDKTLDKRLGQVKASIFDPYEALFKKYPSERQYQAFFLEMKPFQLAYGIEMMFKEILPKLKHGNDGLIFTCRNTPYKHGTDPHILKWKPPEENTMDCRLRLTFPTVTPSEEDRREGITEPFVDYDGVPRSDLWIFNGDSGPEKYELFSPVHISEEEWEVLKGLGDPLNDRIVECNQDEQARWRIVRFRDDKHEANHRTTVQSVLESINDRISDKDLIKIAPKVRDNWKARAARPK